MTSVFLTPVCKKYLSVSLLRHLQILWSKYSASIDMSLSKFQEMVKDREAWHAAVHGVTKSRTWLSDWTATAILPTIISPPTLGHYPLTESLSLLSPGLFFIWYYTKVLLKTLYINTLNINILSETLLTIVQLLVLKQNKFYTSQGIYIWQISKYHNICIWHLQFPHDSTSYRGVTPTAPIPCHLTWRKSSLICFNFGIYPHLYH